MWNRLLYGICLTIALLGLYIKGGTYLNTLRLGHGTTVLAFLDLAYILAIAALAIICVRGLLGRKPRASGGTAAEPIGSQEQSLRSQLQSLSGMGPEALSRRPFLVSLTALFLAAIPICLMTLRAGGWSKLGQLEWILIGLAELPLAFVAAVAFFGAKFRGKQ
jgi:hypothetical protein